MKDKRKGILHNHLFLLRAEKRWTQKYVAEQLGVTRQTIHSLESNKYNPSLMLAFEVANLYGKRIDEIFKYEEQGDV